MTISLTPSKVKKLLKYYFSGLSQQIIAEKLGISQGSVSHWVERFSKQALKIGLLNAAKEYNVLEEIVELRALAVELDKAGMSTTEAKIGTKIMKKFKKLGIEPEQHEALVEVCAQVEDSGFVADALKFHEIQVESGVTHEEAIFQYQQTIQELPVVKEELEKAKTDLEDTSAKVIDQNKKLHKLGEQYNSMCHKVKEVIAKFDNDVTDKMHECEVAADEIEQVATLKADLAKQGLDIPTLVKLAKEIGHGESPD